MKTWEKILRTVQQLPEALASAAHWTAQDWSGFGQRAAIARMEKFYVTKVPHFEIRSFGKTRTVATPSEVGPVKTVTRVADYTEQGDRVLKGQFVTKERKVEFGRSAVMHINQYGRMLKQLEFTNEVVLTDSQRAYIEEVVLNPHEPWGKLLVSVRRKDTGATALVFREGSKYLVLFEDGYYTKANHIPEFDGSWYFNKKVKRAFKPVAEKAAGVMNADKKCFSLQAK